MQTTYTETQILEAYTVSDTATTVSFYPAEEGSIIKVEFDEADENTDNYGWDDYSLTLGWKFKSVEVGGSDDVSAVVTPHEAYEMIAYQSTMPSRVSVAPDTASSSDLIGVEGLSNGSSTIKAKKGDCEVAKFKTIAYTKPQPKTVAVTRIHSAAAPSGFPLGYLCTVNITEAAIEAKLRKVFKQAVVEFDVEVLPDRTVLFDTSPYDQMVGATDASGNADINNAELEIIKAQCETEHDFNIFLVSNPDWTGEPGETLGGIMEKPGKFGFVFESSATTVAHELGHGFADLDHTFDDTENIMSYGPISKWRLRKNQWDLCNGSASE